MLNSMLVAGIGIWSASQEYSAMRHEGRDVGTSLVTATGSAALWTFAPGTMGAIGALQMAIPLMQVAHQVGTQKLAMNRMMMTPYAASYDFANTEIAQQRRYSAVQDLNRTFNVARNQARRMR